MSINDGYGDQSSFDEESTILASYERWLHKVANSYLPAYDARHDDLVQEGRIAMWRALATHEPVKGALPSWLTKAATVRMKEMAFGRGQPTGREATRGVRAVEEVALEPIVDSYGGVDETPFLRIDAMDSVELAYHEGEIHRALDALSPSQREYVFLRFWGGLDPSSRVPEMRALVKEYPVLSKRFLWSGSSKQRGAKQRLAEALVHLMEAA